jgi:hypothetical protein
LAATFLAATFFAGLFFVATIPPVLVLTCSYLFLLVLTCSYLFLLALPEQVFLTSSTRVLGLALPAFSVRAES